jgi:hypothetical protein
MFKKGVPCDSTFFSSLVHLLHTHNSVSENSIVLHSQELYMLVFYFMSHDSPVGIALGYGLDNEGSTVRFPAGIGNFSLRRIKNGSGTHLAFYPMGTRDSFQGGNAAGA